MIARLAKARSLPVVGAVLLVASVLVIGAVGAIGSVGADDDTTAPATSVPASTAAPTTVAERSTTTTTTIAPAPALGAPLAVGSSGDDVQRLQTRLAELGFVPGGDDGYFGALTLQAVWAFEKLVLGTDRSAVTGVVTPGIWQRLMAPETTVEPRRPAAGTANHTEIYLPEQVLAVFHDQQPVFVAHMSPGTGEQWCEEVSISPGEHGNEDGTEPLHVGRCGVSNTPGGVFEYHRMVDGHRDSALGGMLNPVYFNYGIAVHGAYNVPNHPASHGCVRIPNALSERYQSMVDIGERVYVWDGEHEPEHYGAQPPTFDWRWDEYEPRPTTTSAPSTTVPPTTTTAPLTTTTTTPAATTTTSPATTTTTTTTPTIELDRATPAPPSSARDRPAPTESARQRQ